MADSVTVVVVLTAVVGTVNVALVAPAATVTVAGVWADELLSERVTITPPVGAGPVNVTVPVNELPPTTVVGLRVKVFSAGGFTVTVA